ncbi:peptide transporter [Sulfodiicoccus acidiphilus]|uniref:Peptide transporter n=1 Tax=Sulfodiicoccus acidiphilus TaxID=1670455 RepID=A0A348B2F4_9CREN|nr:ABC transporter permease [Sulfodiicoccus acidiphilus]BBD72356.1 peptide transporter [Sulfodiicoccus acidiphilus]GGT90066.1 peptide transporter [Sulfodiicoccus acidiphilus]
MNYLVKRIVERVVLLFAIINFNFFLFQVLPAIYNINPAQLYVPPTYRGLPRSVLVQGLDARFGLNQPLDVRYVKYIIALLTFHFGVSFHYQSPVFDLIAQRFPVTALLVVPSLILSTLLAIGLGIYSAARNGKLGDSVNSFFAILTYFIPAFWLGAIVVYYFGFQLGWFPTNIADAITRNGVALSGAAYWLNLMKFLTLPILLITVLSYGVRMILLRNQSVDLNNSNFIVNLKARGINEKKILYKHIVRNAVLPVFTRVGIDLAFLFAGVVFVEDIFNIPGLGRLLVTAAETLDIPLLSADFYIISLFAIVVLLIMDLLYPLIDPRVRYE